MRGGKEVAAAFAPERRGPMNQPGEARDWSADLVLVDWPLARAYPRSASATSVALDRGYWSSMFARIASSQAKGGRGAAARRWGRSRCALPTAHFHHLVGHGLAVGLGCVGVAGLGGSFVEFLGLLMGRVADVHDA